MITRKLEVRFATLMVLLAVSCFAALHARSDVQGAVTLLYFQGQHNGDNVLLEWATATELNTAYFFLERAADEAGPYHMLEDIGLVASGAPPDGLSGATYQRLDEDGVSANQSYWYVLVEVESSQGAESRTDPVKVVLGETQSTPTATRTPTRAPTATPIATGSAATATAPTLAGATVAPSSPTATALAAGRLSTRTENSSQSAQSGQSYPEPAVIADAQVGLLPQVQEPATPVNGYPARDSADDVQQAESGSAQESYPESPPTPQIFATGAYPAPVGSQDLTKGSSSAVPRIGSANQTPSDNQSDGAQVATNSPLMGTAFLWLGFGAALLVFVCAVAGAIYYYNRQRASSS